MCRKARLAGKMGQAGGKDGPLFNSIIFQLASLMKLAFSYEKYYFIFDLFT